MKTHVSQHTHMTKKSQLILGLALLLLIVAVYVRIMHNASEIVKHDILPTSVYTPSVSSAVVEKDQLILAGLNIPATEPYLGVERWMRSLSTWNYFLKNEELIQLESWMADLHSWGLNDEFVDETPIDVEGWMTDLSSWNPTSGQLSLAETEEAPLLVESWMMDIDSWSNICLANQMDEELPIAVEEWMVSLSGWDCSGESAMAADSISSPAGLALQ